PAAGGQAGAAHGTGLGAGQSLLNPELSEPERCMAQHTIILPGDGSDFAHWRGIARGLWAQQVAPKDVLWLTEDHQRHSPDLFAAPPQVTALAALPPTPGLALTAPRTWVALAEQALL